MAFGTCTALLSRAGRWQVRAPAPHLQHRRDVSHHVLTTVPVSGYHLPAQGPWPATAPARAPSGPSAASHRGKVCGKGRRLTTKEERRADRQAGRPAGRAQPARQPPQALLHPDCHPHRPVIKLSEDPALNCRLLGHTRGGATAEPASVAMAASSIQPPLWNTWRTPRSANPVGSEPAPAPRCRLTSLDGTSHRCSGCRI